MNGTSELRPLPSAGFHRTHRYYAPLRRLRSPGARSSGTACAEVSRVARSSLSLRATSTTPARRSGLRRVHLLSATAFPDKWAGRLSHRAFRGLLGVSLRTAARRVAEPGSPRLLSEGLHAGPSPGPHAFV